MDFSSLDGKKVLVTGGLGFVGMHLINKLLELKAELVILDHSGDLTNLGPIFHLYQRQLNYLKIDIRKSNELKKMFETEKPNYVVHLAGMTNLEKTYSQSNIAIDVNIKGSLNLFQHSKNVDNFVFLSTSDVYGNVTPPFFETQPLFPASPYSASKASAEMFLHMFHKVDNIPLTILRSFNLYGEYQYPNRIIPFIITNLLNDLNVPLTKGEQKREFNYVGDLVDAIIRTLILKPLDGKIINIGCGESISIKEIAFLIASKLDKLDYLKFGSIDYRKNEIWDMYCDNSLAKSILNWKPQISLDEGLDMTLDWYKRNLNT